MSSVGVSRFRWFVVAMLAAAAGLNYLDRQTLALMASRVQADLHIDDRGYAFLVNAFLAAYMLGGVLTAFVADRLGARRAMAGLVGLWSLATAGAGAAGNLAQLAASRFALGLAEAGGWIASPKLVQEWFPQRERATAIGIYSAAAHFGAALAPLAVTTALLAIGWRATFVVAGGIGIFWLALWLLAYRPSHKPPEMVSAETPVLAVERGWHGWRVVMSTRGVWALAIANAVTNPVWFFYLFWFPKYLIEERGLSIATMGGLSWIVYAAAGCGSIAGGLVSGQLVRRGWRPARARIAAMAITALIAPVGAVNATAPAVAVSLALGALVAFTHTAWVTNQTALFVDIYPARHVGKAMAIGNLVAGLVTMGSTYLVGQLVATITYRPMFLVIAVAYPLGLLAAWIGITGQSMAQREAAA